MAKYLSLMYNTIDYLLGGNLVMRNGRIDKYLFDGGYCQATAASATNDTNDTFTAYYYTKDHLGNIREVVDANDSVKQQTNYYPFGATYYYATNSMNPDFQPYKYNGKELDKMHGLNTYDYGARQHDPILGRWDRIDPLCEKYYGVSPYNYCANNPVMLVDPDGRASTDYVDINNGGITTINDGKDNVIAAATFEIEKMKSLHDNDSSEYQEELSLFENSSANLNMDRQQFDTFAGALYAESSGEYDESLGIVNVLENRAANQGSSLEEQLSTKSPYGIYGLKDNGKRYHNEKGNRANIKRANTHRAIAVGLSTDVDVTNGAYFWDGTDIKFNEHYTKWGVTFSQQSHNLWNQKNTKGASQLVTTAAIGKTIFTKFQNQWKKWYISK